MTTSTQTIPAGYKQTEIGVIPEDWDIKKLGDFGKFKSGSGFPVKYQGEISGKYPFYKVSDMNNDGNQIFMKDSNNWINEDMRKIMGANVFPIHAIVFAKIGAAIFLERKKILSRESCMDNNMMGYIIDEGKSDYNFLHYLFLNIRLGKLVSATALPSLNGKQIADLDFAFPKKPEQIAIATALSDTDTLIEKLEKLIAKKKAVKQGAMQQLLTGKKRLPGFSGEWNAVNLGSLGIFKGGSGFPIKYQGSNQGKYPFYKVSDMNNYGNSTFMIDSNNWISEIDRKNMGAYVFPENSIIFAKIGAAIFLERKKILTQQSCIDNNVMGFILNESLVQPRFVHYLFLNIKLGKLVSATALPSLNGKQIAELIYAIPKLPEQTAIATVLSNIDAEIESMEKSLKKYRQIKTGMMQQLLTGKIRLVKN